MPRPAIKNYDDLYDILRDISKEKRSYSHEIVFRGVSEKNHKLRPSLFRDINRRLKTNESNILREMIAKHPADFAHDESVFDRLVRLQHYELPTRLLDVTFNPLVALYFACSGGSKTGGRLYVISVKRSHYKHFDSDTVRCLANLGNLNESERTELKSLSIGTLLKNCNAGRKLSDYVAQERPNWEPRIELSDLKSFFLVNPKLSNPRVQAQAGAFLICGLDEEVRKDSRGISYTEINIERSARIKILQTLEDLGVTESLLFPEIANTAKMIKSRYSPPPTS